MTKKRKIIFKWTAYFILLIILNISLIFGTASIRLDESLNGLKAIFLLEVMLCGCWAWSAGTKEFEIELKKFKKGEQKETEEKTSQKEDVKMEK